MATLLCTPFYLSSVMYTLRMMMYSKSSQCGEKTLEITIEQFLASVEKKAYRMAEIATRSSPDALDIVQDAMIKLVEKYGDKPYQEWKPLFYRILQSRIMDYFRKQKLTRSIFFWRQFDNNEDSQQETLVSQASDHITPERELSSSQSINQVTEALKRLPTRQQQCFLLRSWEGLSVKQTAEAMKCSEGSVKTHYARAKESLKKALNDE
jgi:RNA polymerase sigma-70 factor, ECF subfamily